MMYNSLKQIFSVSTEFNNMPSLSTTDDKLYDTIVYYYEAKQDYILQVNSS